MRQEIYLQKLDVFVDSQKLTIVYKCTMHLHLIDVYLRIQALYRKELILMR